MGELSFAGEMARCYEIASRACRTLFKGDESGMCALYMFRACECFVAEVMRRFLAKEDVLQMLRRGFDGQKRHVNGAYVVEMLAKLDLTTGLGECIMKVVPNRGRGMNNTLASLDGSHLSISCHMISASFHSERVIYCKYIDMYGSSFRDLPDVTNAFDLWLPSGKVVRGSCRGPLPAGFMCLVDAIHICI
jgi:hypothetical protein